MLNVVLLKKIWLKKEEVPILVIRSSLLNWFWQFLISGLLLVGAFFLMYFLWQFDWYGLAIFGAMVAAAIYIFSRSCCEFYYTCWILTNLRLIDLYQRGFLKREVSEVVYNKIKDVYGKKSSALNMGDIYVSLIGSQVKLMLRRVRDFDRGVAEITLQQENYQKNLTDEKERKAQYLLLKIKNKIGAAAFNKLLGD